MTPVSLCQAARLELLAEVQHWGRCVEAATPHGQPVTGRLTARIAGLFDCESAVLSLSPGDVRRVVLTPDDCPALLLPNATTSGVLWWPWQMGDPTQHTLRTAFALSPSPSPSPSPSAPSASSASSAPQPPQEVAVSTTLVGLREANVTLDANDNAVVSVNGRRILVLGGGWAPDLLQRVTAVRNARQLRLTRDLGLNAVRLEGKFLARGRVGRRRCPRTVVFVVSPIVF